MDLGVYARQIPVVNITITIAQHSIKIVGLFPSSIYIRTQTCTIKTQSHERGGLDTTLSSRTCNLSIREMYGVAWSTMQQTTPSTSKLEVKITYTPAERRPGRSDLNFVFHRRELEPCGQRQSTGGKTDLFDVCFCTVQPSVMQAMLCVNGTLTTSLFHLGVVCHTLVFQVLQATKRRFCISCGYLLDSADVLERFFGRCS